MNVSFPRGPVPRASRADVRIQPVTTTFAFHLSSLDPNFIAKETPVATPGEIKALTVKALKEEGRTGCACRLWGRVGELCVALLFGVRLCRRNVQGHDGRLGNDFVEIKTITPRKRKPFVRAKRAGNFSQLAVVRVYDDLTLQILVVPRDRLPTGRRGRYLKVPWSIARDVATMAGSMAL